MEQLYGHADNCIYFVVRRTGLRKLFNKMEQKLGRFAIRNLMIYITAIYAIGFFIARAYPEMYVQYLSLDVAKLFEGEIWRIFTFILQPPTTSLFFIIFSLYLYYMLGRMLENIWGPFKFNVYYFSGVIMTIVAAIIIYLVTGISYTGISTYYINMSLFLAFATVNPDMQLLFMFLIPIKMKWLAYLDVALLAYQAIVGSWAIRISIIVSLVNFIVYFFIFMKDTGRSAGDFYRRYQYRKNSERGYRSGSSGGQYGSGSGFGGSDAGRDARSAGRPSWTASIWSSDTARNAQAATSTVTTICSRMYTYNNLL